MMRNQPVQDDTFEILIGELLTDEALRDAFFRDPQRTLQEAAEWPLPLSASELHALRSPAYRLRDRVADALEARLPAAA